MGRMVRLLRLLCLSSMQTYYLCIIFFGLCGSCIYLLVYTFTLTTFSPLVSCGNEGYSGNFTGAGFLMALDYSDQLTGGGMNLFCLQCLAASIDPRLVVVEPFIVQSTFGADLDLRNQPLETPWKENAVRMSHVYNMKRWLEYSKEKCFAPLVPWEALLKSAPRSVVLVQHTWDKCTLNDFWEKYAPFFSLYHFDVIRQVCFNFRSTREVKLWQYQHSIYGDLDPRNVTVIYQKWLGIGKTINKYTVSISDSYCEKASNGDPLFNGLHVSPSLQLYSDASNYVSHFLGEVKDDMYIAVMFRIEKIFLSTKRRRNKLFLVSRCLNSLINKWQSMKTATGINKTFLALDYGTYGSKGFLLHRYMDRDSLEVKLQTLLDTMEQGPLSQWESGFRKISGKENPGYIASLQQTIASKARCLITVGGGSFQNHAFVMHEKAYGKTCYIRLKTNCKVLDSNIHFSSQQLFGHAHVF